VNDTLWWATLVGAGVGVILSLAASISRRHWLALPALLPVAAAIVLGVLAVARPGAPWFSITLGAAMLLLGTIGGSPLVAFVLSTAIEEYRTEERKPKAKRRGPEVLRGGATIGHLERLATMGAVLLGQPAAIAVVVAIKGLGRFSELDSSAVRERFIIGTLVSLGWAGACTAAITLSW